MRRHILLFLLIILVLCSSTYAGDFTQNLIHAYNFGNTAQLEDQVGTDDSVSNSVISKIAIGIDGTGWNMSFNPSGGSSSRIQMPNTLLDNFAAISINVWFNWNSTENDPYIISGVGGSGESRLRVRNDPQYVGQWTTDDNIEAGPITSVVWSTSVWYMATWTYDGVNVCTYLNATLIGSCVAATGLTNSDIGTGFGSRYDGADSVAFGGVLDEIYIWDKNLTQANISDLWDGGTGLFLSEFLLDAVSPPVFSLPTPPDNAIRNANQTINVSHNGTDIRYYLFVNDIPFFLNVTESGPGYFNWTTNFTDDGTFKYSVMVQNVTAGGSGFSNNITRNLVIDTANPTIILNPSNAFNTSNISSHNQYLNFMRLNITFNDETGLFAVLVNVTQNGVSYFNHTNTSLNNELSHNFTKNLSTLTWPDGVFDINITVADGSTIIKIEDYKVSRFLSRITFDTEEKNVVDIIGSGAISTEYTKKQDRYEFGFNYLTKETTRKFTVRCDNELYYMDNPNKVGHFVCWNSGTRTGNWIDFQGLGEDYVVEKIKEREYDITFINIPLSKKVSLKSIGGLNVVNENYQWFKGSTTNIFSATAISGSQQQFQINISLDFDLVKDIDAKFTYNDTFRTVTETVLPSNIVFESTFNVPDVNRTFNFSWIFNITQRNQANYSFSVNSTQELTIPQVNLSIFDEENQTLILEDLTIFFTGPSNVETNTSSGTLDVGGLTFGEYFIQAEGATYPRRGLFFTVTNASAKVNLYLVQDRTGNEFIDYIVQDDGRNRLENARLTFLKNINNSFITMAQLETDFAGQARIFQDQQNEYRIILFLAGFETQTISLIPLLTGYTLTLSIAAEQLFETTYEGIRYTISPAARVLNASGNRNISITIFDSESSLEFFGLEIVNHSYACVPANCLTNVSGSPAGGTAIVQINLNTTGSFDTQYFFKRNGFPIQFINGQRSSVRFLIGDRLATNFQTIGDNLGTPVMRAIFAAILITVLAVLASQIGVVGLGLMLVISFGTIFFMLLGFIPKMVAMITLFFGVAIYFVLGRET